MAGTVAFEERLLGTIKQVIAAWTSSTGGAADGTTTNAYSGLMQRFTTVPSTTAAPTDDYDVVLNDGDSLDVLLAGGADRDTANTEHIVGSTNFLPMANQPLTVGVSAAGNAKKGTIYFWLRP